MSLDTAAAQQPAPDNQVLRYSPELLGTLEQLGQLKVRIKADSSHPLNAALGTERAPSFIDGLQQLLTWGATGLDDLQSQNQRKVSAVGTARSKLAFIERAFEPIEQSPAQELLTFCATLKEGLAALSTSLPERASEADTEALSTSRREFLRGVAGIDSAVKALLATPDQRVQPLEGELPSLEATAEPAHQTKLLQPLPRLEDVRAMEDPEELAGIIDTLANTRLVRFQAADYLDAIFGRLAELGREDKILELMPTYKQTQYWGGMHLRPATLLEHLMGKSPYPDTIEGISGYVVKREGQARAQLELGDLVQLANQALNSEVRRRAREAMPKQNGRIQRVLEFLGSLFS